MKEKFDSFGNANKEGKCKCNPVEKMTVLNVKSITNNYCQLLPKIHKKG